MVDSKECVADLVTKNTGRDEASEAVADGSAVGGGLTDFEREVVAVFEDLVGLLGMPKSLGEIYGLLFASAEPLAFADIEQKLRLSKGSVSQGLRALRELGAVREAGGGTSGTVSPLSAAKVTRWEAATELRALIGTILRERLTPYLQRQDARVESAGRALEAQEVALDGARFKALKNRLDKLQTWQSRARTVLPVIGKLL